MSKFIYLKKQYLVKIPNNIKVLHCTENRIITFLGPLQTKSIKLEMKILFFKKQQQLFVTNISFSHKPFKILKQLQGTTCSKLKQILVEINYTLYLKFKFVGIGYRAFNFESAENQLYLKLGYSHLIYFYIPKPLKTFCIRFTKLYIFGNSSYNFISQLGALLRNCRVPDPYKGQGILYYEEKIILKRGKRI
jgi:large subunit ribosomal protein L6